MRLGREQTGLGDQSAVEEVATGEFNGIGARAGQLASQFECLRVDAEDGYVERRCASEVTPEAESVRCASY